MLRNFKLCIYTYLTLFLAIHVQLLINIIINSTNHMVALQCI